MIIDHNRYAVERSMELRPNFGYHNIDGHDVAAIYQSFKNVRASFVLCNTIKGCGIPSIYDSPMVHYTLPNTNNIEQFRKEICDYTKRCLL